jgi:uncharacterized membrane protein
MTAVARLPRFAPRAWITLILLAAAALRLVALDGAPPGMTHDEADHGLTALSIRDGARALYFSIGYGREPLYDYATAVVMSATGPTILAPRLTSVYFSLLLIAAVYAWARRAFGAPVALLTAAGLAGGFWPIMTARQALRSSALPAVFALAVLFFWIGLFRNRVSGRNPVSSHYSPLAPFLIAGLLLGLSFYTYLPARIMWLALPVLVGYGWLCRRDLANRPARGLLFTLAVAALVAAPLLLYLAARPALEVRVGELSAPLRAATGGDFAPLWANATAALRLFTIEGDQTWRYNVPGRPLLPGVLGWLFYAGLLVAGWQVVVGLKRKATTDYTDFTDLRVLKSVKSVVAFSSPGAFLALVWLALGFTPVLVTGPGLSTTQAIGMLPVLYVFPALALVAGWRAITNYELRITNAAKEPHAKVSSLRSWRSWRSLREVFSSPATRYLPLASLLVVLLYVTVATASARAYFGLWANSPEVRVQYETTMVTALRYLDAHGRGAAAVSTITPGPFHTPAVAALTLHNPAVQPRWFDGRESLLLPDEPDATLVIPGFTPIPPALQPYLAAATLSDELSMRPDDLDRPIRLYAVDGPATIAAALARMTAVVGQSPATFGENVELLGYELSTTTAQPGETVTLVTAWRVRQPLPGAALFAHVIGPDALIAQADSLGAPGESWMAGDVLLQLHTLTLPVAAAPGDYPLAVGVYTRPDGARLRLPGGGDMLTLTTLTLLAPENNG